MKKLYYGYCSYTYSTLFLDEDFKYVSDLHENDAEWRGEYFNPILIKMGVQAIRISNLDDILESYSEDLENHTKSLWNIDFKEFEKLIKFN